MADDEMDVRWAELRIGLARPSGASPRPAARELFGVLRESLDGWARAASVRWCWFMRKPPDVRLRLGGGAPERAVADLAAVLERLTDSGRLRGWAETVYEPETDKFGGPDAMGAAHAHFDADSRSWLDLDPLAVGSPVDPRAVVAAAADDLLVRLLDDGGEVGDAWCDVVTLTGFGSGDDEAEGLSDEVAEPAGWSLEAVGAALVPILGARAVDALARYSSANRDFADRVRRDHTRGRLTTRPQALGALVVQYQAHRWGMDGAATAALAAEAAVRWNPGRARRGGSG